MKSSEPILIRYSDATVTTYKNVGDIRVTIDDAVTLDPGETIAINPPPIHHHEFVCKCGEIHEEEYD